MQDEEPLIRHLVSILGVGPQEAARIVGEVLDHYREPVEAYVRRRHAECRLRGMRNEEIYELIRGELDRRLVAPPPLTSRQVRRIIYT